MRRSVDIEISMPYHTEIQIKAEEMEVEHFRKTLEMVDNVLGGCESWYVLRLAESLQDINDRLCDKPYGHPYIGETLQTLEERKEYMEYGVDLLKEGRGEVRECLQRLQTHLRSFTLV